LPAFADKPFSRAGQGGKISCRPHGWIPYFHIRLGIRGLLDLAMGWFGIGVFGRPDGRNRAKKLMVVA
jgi:hypothetical protein